MPSVSPRNIDPVLADIRKPGARRDAHPHRPVVHLEHESLPSNPGSPLLKRIILITLTTLVTLAVGGGLLVAKNVVDARRLFTAGGGKVAENFLLSLDALGRFDTGTASERLSENQETFALFERFLDDRFGAPALDLIRSVVPVVGEGQDLISRVAHLNAGILSLSDGLTELQSSGMRYFTSDGERLVALLGRLREQVGAIRAGARDVKNLTGRLREAVPALAGVDTAFGDYYVRRSVELDEMERFLGGVADLLGSQTDRHIVLLFQNPGELRPGGGFLGSYADLTVRKGQLIAMDVRDTYDPDGQLEENVVPPHELQTITERWGARDANWFFDFPLSAKTTLDFLEASKMYSERGIRFDAAVALNIDVFRSVLEAVGPVELPKYKLTVTPANFLDEVQREVEAGKDKAAGEPKRILKDLGPLVLARLAGLPSETVLSLIERLGEHLAKKDVMLYALDPALTSFLTSRGADGAVAALPNGFWGGYLAVVDANVAGGKSDAFVEQAINARLDVSTDGGVLSDLSVVRTHRGDKQKDSWWRATNQNFIQVLVNPGSSLVGVTGNDVKVILPSVDYATSGFVMNEDLARLEDARAYSSAEKTWSGPAFGKTVFGTWLSLAAGKTKTLEVRSQSPGPADFSPAPGKIFTFLFDRQSGVRTSLKVTVLAPLGYVWAETQGPLFVKEFSDPAARETVALTLAK